MIAEFSRLVEVFRKINSTCKNVKMMNLLPKNLKTV